MVVEAKGGVYGGENKNINRTAKIIKSNIFNKKLAASIDVGRIANVLNKDE